jgi:hypothetical protein
MRLRLFQPVVLVLFPGVGTLLLKTTSPALKELK